MPRYTPTSPVYIYNFPFLDLPPELRCMVYEFLEMETRCHTLSRDEAGLSNGAWPVNPTSSHSAIELIRHSLPVALLRTSRLINREATPTFGRKLAKLKQKPLNFQVDYAALIGLTDRSGPLARSTYSLNAAEWSPPSWSPCSLQAVGPPNEAMRIFAARCGAFVRRKPSFAASDAVAPVSVCITITQPHANLRDHLTEAAFFGTRRLRQFSGKFVCDVVYHQKHIWAPSLGGAIPVLPTIRVKGLRTWDWDVKMRELEQMRMKESRSERKVKFLSLPWASEKFANSSFA